MTLILVLALAQAASAAPPPPQRPPVDCNDTAHRAYDFFVGDWDVTDTKSGRPIAHSRIEKVLGGCAMQETYDQTMGPAGKPMDYHGNSYSAVETLGGGWRQFYVDSTGTAANLTGGIENGAMVLTGATGTVTNRMTVAPQADGSVRQSGALSQDGGQTWQPGYDFTYRRRPRG